jgi:hypothetical protein
VTGASYESAGMPFPPAGERFDRLEEQLAILTGLWDTPPWKSFSFHRKHYRIENCVNSVQFGSPPRQGGKPNCGPLPADILPLEIRPEVHLSSFLVSLWPSPGGWDGFVAGPQQAARLGRHHCPAGRRVRLSA